MKKNPRKKEIKRITVWLDHKSASIYRPARPVVDILSIASGIEPKIRIPGETADGIRLGRYRFTNNEAHKHNRLQNQLRGFYKKIATAVSAYDEITIAGPTTAGRELYNFLSAQKEFKEKRLFVLKGSMKAPVVKVIE